MRAVFLVALAVLMVAPFQATAQPVDAERVELTAFAVDLRPREPEEIRVGRLRYLGGIVLRSPDGRFSGISGLRFVNEGARLLAISDRGHWISFAPLFEGERLVGAGEAYVWPMLDETGARLRRPAYDAESLTLIGDAAYVGFEREHRIDVYRNLMGSDNPRPERFRDAATFGAQANNGSLEGLTLLASGRLLAIAEEPNDDSTFDGWLMSADGSTESLALFAVSPYKLTDLATLPGGDVVTLERRFSPVGGVGARLRLIPAARIAPSALLDGEELASMGADYTVDNMEGIAVRARDDRTEIFIISDDNQNPLQRTILMAFELVEE